MKFIAFYLVLIALPLAAPLSAQLGGEITGDSAQRAGMAGAGMAGAASVFDAAMNPAALSFMDDRTMGFEGVGRLLWVPISIDTVDGGSYEASNTIGGGPWLGWAGRLRDDVRYSISFMPSGGGQADYSRMTTLNLAADEDVNGDFIPRQHEVDMSSLMLQVSLSPSISWRASKHWSFGAGASLRYTKIDLKSAADVAISSLTGEVPGMGGLTWADLFNSILALGGRPEVDSLQADIDASLDAPLHAFLQVGTMWQPREGTRLSMWYRSPSTSNDIEGDVLVDLSAELGEIFDVLPGGLSATDNFFLSIPAVNFPQQLGVAFMRELKPGSRMFADAVWTDWSNSFDGWKAVVTDGQGDLGAMTSSDGIIVDMDMRWEDTLRFSIGYEHDLFATSRVVDANGRTHLLSSGKPMTIRAGLGHSNNPIIGAANAGLIPFNSVHLAAGCTWWGGQGGGDWHLGVVAALPQGWTSGDNAMLSDASGDHFNQSNLAIAVGWSANW